MEQEKSSSVGRFTSAAPKMDRKAKDLFALVTVGIVGLIAAALLALAFHLAVQGEPELAPLAKSNDSVTPPADMASSPGVSKRFTDRLPIEDETDASGEDGPAPAAGGKKITDRIFGDMEVPGQ